jgi:two-component system, cell cycle sensor histidine kinase and response regulator CckA
LSRDPIKLLAVEDDPSLSFVLEEALQHAAAAEIDAVMVSSLRETRERLDEERFELVLLDLSLPDSDGIETFSAVRRLAPRVPVVVLTGSDDPELERRIRELGAADFLLKGAIGSKTLIDKIRLVARGDGAASEPPPRARRAG